MLYGVHPVTEALRHGGAGFDRVLLARDRRGSRAGEIHRLCREKGIPVHFVPAQALDRLTRQAAHQGVVAYVAARAYASLQELIDRAGEDAILVLADGIQDPRNLGAIVRTAGAAGAAGVVIPAHGSCGLTPAVAKAAAGALAFVPVAREGNLAALIPTLRERGFSVVGLDPRGEKVWSEADLTGRLALVLGGEGGLRPLVRSRCDHLVSLPMPGQVESLNVSVAAGVVLYEAIRQRKPGAGR